MHFVICCLVVQVFTPEVILHYLRIFNFLWRAKRMEYCLTGIWKNQMSSSRFLQRLPGKDDSLNNLSINLFAFSCFTVMLTVGQILRRTHLLLSLMSDERFCLT